MHAQCMACRAKFTFSVSNDLAYYKILEIWQIKLFVVFVVDYLEVKSNNQLYLVIMVWSLTREC
jgi:uncharacterized protein (DUF983 family)